MEGSGLYHAPTLGKNPGTDLIGGWVESRGGLDVLEMITSFPAGIRILNRPYHSLIATSNTLSIPASYMK